MPDTGTTPKQKFTSYEREFGASPAGDLDYAVFRYHYPRLGRFTAPDPIAGSATDPQTLNGYAYVRDDPTNSTDPLGLWISTGRGGGYPYESLPINWEPSLPAPIEQNREGRDVDSIGKPQECTLTVSSDFVLSQETRGTIEQIFRNAGVGISWTHGSSAELRVQEGSFILTWFRNNALGYNPPGTNIAQINTNAIAAQALTYRATAAQQSHAIGVVVAHEFGHSLLRRGDHSARGLMRPGDRIGWTQFDTSSTFPGGALNFTPTQARLIQQRCWQLRLGST